MTPPASSTGLGPAPERKTVFPDPDWERWLPQEVGFSEEKLRNFEAWLRDLAGDEPFHLAVVRGGALMAEWEQGIPVEQPLPQASASKSFFSCLLGIAVAEGKIASPDARVVDYYPEMMDVVDGEGPKPGRFAREKDREITFRQLIGNTSGYLKPDEAPGRVFHYQTFGMNILTNALATVYGLYDSREPDRLPGCGRLIEEKLRDPIGGAWSYVYGDFPHPPEARVGIFGHYTNLVMTARDAARAGHLWLNGGWWNGVQVVPEAYLRQATVTNADIRGNEPEENWKYGLGFWVNDHAKLWPDLPRDSYAAWGAGAKHIWVCPSLGLVVVQNPGPWDRLENNQAKERRQNEILARLLEAVDDGWRRE
jgi:CubicO group peptidase (beta-lactamase class C family)